MAYLRTVILNQQEGRPVAAPGQSPTRRAIASVLARSIARLTVAIVFSATLAYVAFGAVAAFVVALGFVLLVGGLVALAYVRGRSRR